MIRTLVTLLQIGIIITSGFILMATQGLTPPFTPEIHYASVKDAQIAYYIRGDGKPLLLIEGFGMSMEDWDPFFIRELAKHHKIIVFDLREAGLSKGDITHLTVSQVVEDTIGLLDHEKIQKVNIFGWSMGSLVAQEIVLSYPERVDKLILASTLSADKHSIYMEESVGKKIQNDVLSSWEKFVPYMFTQDESGKIAANAYLARREKSVQSGEAPLTPKVVMDVKQKQQEAVGILSIEDDRLEKLTKITRPVLIMGGASDILIPVENNRIVAEAIPNAELAIFPGVGHAFLFNEVQEVTDTINQFLQ